jgi:hypothetical protein
MALDSRCLRESHESGSTSPIALLPEHATALIAAWFAAHPSVEVIAHDRATIYAEARATGAPHAQQVAHRWHLTHNLGSVLQDMLTRHTRALREVAHLLTAYSTPLASDSASPRQIPLPELPGHIVRPPDLRQTNVRKPSGCMPQVGVIGGSRRSCNSTAGRSSAMSRRSSSPGG